MSESIKIKEKVFEKFPNYYRLTELNLLKNENNNIKKENNSQYIKYNFNIDEKLSKIISEVSEFDKESKYMEKDTEKDTEKSTDSDNSDEEEIDKKLSEINEDKEEKNIEKYDSSDIEEFSVYEESEDSGEFSS